MTNTIPRHTTAIIAAEVGITHDLAKYYARQYNLGTLVSARLRLWSDADRDKLKSLTERDTATKHRPPANRMASIRRKERGG